MFIFFLYIYVIQYLRKPIIYKNDKKTKPRKKIKNIFEEDGVPDPQKEFKILYKHSRFIIKKHTNSTEIKKKL